MSSPAPNASATDGSRFGRAPGRWQGLQAVVVGAARSGCAAAELLLDLGAAVVLTDLRPRSDLVGRRRLDALLRRGVELVAGGHPDSLWADADAVVSSPGVPAGAPVLEAARAAGLPPVTEVELAASLTDAPLVAVTGSNGKSTVTAMVGEILRGAGLDVAVCGNIGRPFSDAVRRERAGERLDRYVLELSSFQTEAIVDLRPRWASILNLGPDHLDRHPTFDQYADAKLRIARNCGPEDWLVYGSDDDAVAARVDRVAARRDGPRTLPFHHRPRRGRELDGPAAWIEGGEIHVRTPADAGPVVAVEDLPILGRHNHANACAAAALGILAGADRPVAARALRRFSGLEHRMEVCPRPGDVVYVNDSKATNVDATLAALDGIDAPIWLILGGRDKNGGFERLRPPLRRKVVRTLLVGEAAGRIAAALSGAGPVERCGTLARALHRARLGAEAGDVVLLAPACTSFDQFSDFEARGRRFKELVAESAPAVPVDGSEGGI